ncbi:hypothetical protein llap_11427 [Limosa lapponica baueri]|uniref:Glycolipid transfer protein domain-containing protein n=1 Tax=Limosa lapponica baueri TaxID=1758121 RepID=A0A2I0TWT3_LIMLA|nr:hypothetical protein llap_11427 [Limosa lapponica baueri]
MPWLHGRQMELNPCENGSVKSEINHQEQTLIKSLECLNLGTNEGSSDVSVEDHIAEDLADNAYGKTLRQHHGWVVRGVFALALRAAPTYEDFVAALSVEECDPQEETFYKGMQRDLNIYLPAMEKQLNILDTLYEVHGLESDEVV